MTSTPDRLAAWLLDTDDDDLARIASTQHDTAERVGEDTDPAQLALWVAHEAEAELDRRAGVEAELDRELDG